MSIPHNSTDRFAAALADIDRLRPAEELAVYEQILEQLTDMLNTPEEPTPGEALA